MIRRAAGADNPDSAEGKGGAAPRENRGGAQDGKPPPPRSARRVLLAHERKSHGACKQLRKKQASSPASGKRPAPLDALRGNWPETPDVFT
jgi:hypothetical protein